MIWVINYTNTIRCYIFTVLHCGNVPDIINTESSAPITPWLPGAEVTYSCADGFNLQTTSTILCEVDRSSALWTGVDQIRCSPGINKQIQCM